MTLEEGKQKFIAEWGCLSINWGISRTMGMIHAILLITPDEMCAEEVMDQLQVSRGTANTNIRTLIDWGLVKKVLKTGHRKEYFKAEKDIWKVLQCIIQHRKKKELDPLNALLRDLEPLKAQCPKSEEFCKITRELKQFTTKADKTLDSITASENNWLINSVFSAFR